MLRKWVYKRDIRIELSQPGAPTDHATIESFNGRLRQGYLNENRFIFMADVRCEIKAFRIHYIESHPHSALNWKTLTELSEKPADFKNK